MMYLASGFIEVLIDVNEFLHQQSVVVPWKRYSGEREMISSVGLMDRCTSD
jgi:hypothetical protein